MSKKDYILLANILSLYDGTVSKQDLVHVLCQSLRADNPRFSKQKFIYACYPNSTVTISNSDLTHLDDWTVS